ncbi:hypothetical protein HK100_006964 [Physocladia obscura]|uniref:Rrn7/TAF1B C-terminal cyclin domain-containing protein n=1 Tax=Physocladia obscura TaxID=109957 RepID=A0AAD5SVJ8_9FUNG|nr:hypothetical protein HK100_006964 [Physocladia obscura]
MHALTALLASLKTLYATSCGIVFPEINRPLILLRLVKTYKLPLEIYVCAEIVRSIIELDHFKALRAEVLMVSCLIVAIRMCYSLEKSKRNIFISWLTNLPSLDSLLKSIKLQLHRDRALAMNKRTLTDLDSEFNGYANEFLLYCKNYLFEKPRIQPHYHGMRVVVDELNINSQQNLSLNEKFSAQPQEPQHQLDSAIIGDPSSCIFSTNFPPASDDANSYPMFNIKRIADVADTVGEVEYALADLIDFGSKVLILDGRVVLKGVVAVEKALGHLVELIEMQL